MMPSKRLSLISAAWLLFAAIAVYCTGGCDGFWKSAAQDYLIRIGKRKVTVKQFQQAFENTKALYAQETIQNPVVVQDARISLLREMTEELILLERARELGLEATEAEVDAAIAAIREDYPDDTFKEMLIENAVSFNFWKKRLEDRLTVQKVIERELAEQSALTPDEINTYYQQQLVKASPAPDAPEPEKDHERILSHLRSQKAEDAYAHWIKGLKDRYVIEFNESAWQRLLNES